MQATPWSGIAPASEPAPRSSEEDSALAGDAIGGEFEETSLAPDEWIENILELKREGPEDAWRVELDAFLEIFPDFPLPAELSEALNKPAREE